jgi:putative photosynthetic complex assembly protein 2
MSETVLLAVGAVFLWWLSTGVILLAVRWADRAGGGAHGMVVFAGVPFLSLGVAAVILSAGAVTMGSVVAGFLGALAIWGWVELAFLTGIVAGPDRRDCPPGLTGWPRFTRAWGAIAHHELALLLGLMAIAAVVVGAANMVALWTYLILFAARISAKLNLFFGVPRINVEFVPARLAHLKSYFRQGRTTLAFPMAISALSVLTGLLTDRALRADGADQAALILLTTLAALALLEHWLMVVPLPDAKLWRWMLPSAQRHLTDKEAPDEL